MAVARSDGFEGNSKGLKGNTWRNDKDILFNETRNATAEVQFLHMKWP